MSVAQACDPQDKGYGPETVAADPKQCQWDVSYLESSCLYNGNQFGCDFADQVCQGGSAAACDSIASAKRWAVATAVMTGVANGLNADAARQQSTVVRIPPGYGAKAARDANAQQLRVYCGQLAERGLAQSYYFYSAGCGR
jgi:hypothetical protein